MRRASWAVATLLMVTPAVARADGAFPAVDRVLLAPERPQEIILPTNFGVVLTEDGGATWSWSCEQDVNAFGAFYQLGPTPRRRLFAVANQHVIFSDDATCSWRIAGGLLVSQSVTDVFPDPTDADRVLAVGLADNVYGVFESADGGATFTKSVYQTVGVDSVTGVEIARSDPRVVYVALGNVDHVPRLARSTDGGATWVTTDLSNDLGAGVLRIIAVDPDDADTVLLRWSGADGTEALGLTHDGGLTATKPLVIPTYFTAFARMPNGALILSAVSAISPALKAALFVSHDGGTTFTRNDAVPTISSIAERGGVLFATTDNFVDGYALGSSSDEGATWQPVLRFEQVGSILACLRADPQCQASCQALAGVGVGSPGKIWEEAVCTDASSGTGAGGEMGTGGAGGAGATGGSGGGAVVSDSSGDCALAPAGTGGDPGLGVVLAAFVVGRLARKRKRARARAARPRS